MGWHTRCCADVFIGNCTACIGDGSNVPATMTVVLAGIADNVCANGEAYNGTYILPWNFNCHWYSLISPRICPTDPGDTAGIDFWVTKILGGNYVVYVKIQIYDSSRTALGTYTFKYDSGQSTTAWDCMNFSSLALSYDSKTVDFDWIDCTAATATVTSGA